MSWRTRSPSATAPALSRGQLANVAFEHRAERGIRLEERSVEQAARQDDPVDRCVESNRRTEDTPVLGRVVGGCMAEAHLGRREVDARSLAAR
jgi:hypothetical protein